MSENFASNILIKMSEQIGEINGTVNTYIKGQAKTNEALFKLVEAQETRIKEIEGTKNKVIGAIAVSAMSSGGLGFFLSKLFNGHH